MAKHGRDRMTSGIIERALEHGDHMTKRLMEQAVWALGIALASLAIGTVAGGAGSASAAHCTDNGGPGNSDFATHVQTATHSEGGTHKGWSSCVPGNPNFTG